MSAEKEIEDLSIDESYIKSILQQIVNKIHTNPDKQHVRAKVGGGFQIACPYCGDSYKNANKYRGNLNGILFYKCFNDGCERKTHFTSMCKDFEITIDGETKKKIYDYLDRYTNNVETLQDELLENGLNHLVNLEDLEKCINTNECESALSDFKPIQPGSAQYFYLSETRGLDPRLYKNIYQAKFHVGGDWFEKVIIFLNRKKNKIIGAQVRNLKDGGKRLFHIYTFEDLYNMVGKEELSDGQKMMYNKLSYYYGILEVDFNKIITIFEGYGDAILWPNSIGIAGVNTDLKFMEENGLMIKYFFDNDDAGHRKSEEKIKSGFSSFLWKKMFEWIVDKKGTEDPFYHYNKISTVNDLTKLNLVIPEAYTKLNMEDFFSVDKYDLKYIPKVVEKRWIKIDNKWVQREK
tara:strand:+ start:15009 stop:16226 length:1218 start_codon:yes stop_codon:yes gene_type:complete